MKFNDAGASGKLFLVGLLVLACILPLSIQEKEKTYGHLEERIRSSGHHLKCYACNSINDECTEPEPKQSVECKETGFGTDPPGYLATVYGNYKRNGIEQRSIHRWPPSLTETPGEMEPGWTDASFPTEYKPYGKLVEQSFSYSSLHNATIYWNGYQTCRKMKIYTTDKYKNNGKTTEIPAETPRIIRTCSFHPEKELGCNTYTYKSATAEVCYCKGNNCNGSSYLRISQYWILAAFLLVFFINLGMNVY